MLYFVCGGGNAESLIEINVEFSKIISKNAKILYLPHAIDENHRSVSESFQYFRKMMSFIDINDIDICLDLEDRQISKKQYDVLYIAGGELKKLTNKIDKYMIEKFIAKNAFSCIYGHSAGAIALGIDTDFYNKKQKHHLWSLIKNHEIICHYNERKDTILSSNNNQLLLPDNTAVIFKDNQIIKLIGSGIVYRTKKDA
ncbi:Type 1 glutamine amidotransferase-like domain-containing protein [Macrococcus capreoli]